MIDIIISPIIHLIAPVNDQSFRTIIFTSEDVILNVLVLHECL